jgi:hypothetical protein
MEPSSLGRLRRPDLQARAAQAARALLARFGSNPSDELRNVIGYWQAAELALERAAQHVITYAAALGVPVPPAQPTPPAPGPTRPAGSEEG